MLDVALPLGRVDNEANKTILGDLRHEMHSSFSIIDRPRSKALLARLFIFGATPAARFAIAARHRSNLAWSAPPSAVRVLNETPTNFRWSIGCAAATTTAFFFMGSMISRRTNVSRGDCAQRTSARNCDRGDCDSQNFLGSRCVMPAEDAPRLVPHEALDRLTVHRSGNEPSGKGSAERMKSHAVDRQASGR